MNTKALIWGIFGLILVLGGIVMSVQEGRELKSRGPVPVADSPHVNGAVNGGTHLFPDGNRNMSPDIDTGFAIDPIKGLKRKDNSENVDYFK